MDYLSIEALRDNVESTIEKANKENKTFLIGDGKEPSAVLMSLENWELIQETIQFYSDPENIETLSKHGKKEFINFEDINFDNN